MSFESFFLLFAFFFEIVDVLELVHIDSIHLEVKHVELVLNDVFSLALLLLSPLKTSLDKFFNIFILHFDLADLKDLIGSIIDHVLKLLFLEALVLWC
jgi:hypothetical protein